PVRDEVHLAAAPRERHAELGRDDPAAAEVRVAHDADLQAVARAALPFALRATCTALLLHVGAARPLARGCTRLGLLHHPSPPASSARASVSPSAPRSR